MRRGGFCSLTLTKIPMLRPRKYQSQRSVLLANEANFRQRPPKHVWTLEKVVQCSVGFAASWNCERGCARFVTCQLECRRNMFLSFIATSWKFEKSPRNDISNAQIHHDALFIFRSPLHRALWHSEEPHCSEMCDTKKCSPRQLDKFPRTSGQANNNWKFTV